MVEMNKRGKGEAEILNHSLERHNEKFTPLPDTYEHIVLISETRQ